MVMPLRTLVVIMRPFGACGGDQRITEQAYSVRQPFDTPVKRGYAYSALYGAGQGGPDARRARDDGAALDRSFRRTVSHPDRIANKNLASAIGFGDSHEWRGLRQRILLPPNAGSRLV